MTFVPVDQPGGWLCAAVILKGRGVKHKAHGPESARQGLQSDLLDRFFLGCERGLKLRTDF